MSPNSLPRLPRQVLPFWLLLSTVATLPALSFDQLVLQHNEHNILNPTHGAPAAARQDDSTRNHSVTHEIHQYVFDYAPLVHLYSGEEFWPCDIAKHLHHTMPYLNYTPLDFGTRRVNLSGLDDLNIYKREVYLTSDDNVENRPDWLGGRKNIPEGPEQCKLRRSLSQSQSRDEDSCPGGRSDAPATLIVVPKEDGVVDAFWFFFYSYNLGNKVLRVRFGNHVGDWEHTVVRFKDGEPIEVFLSEHTFGDAYSYAAMEKIGKRVSVSQEACSQLELTDLSLSR